MCRFIDVILEYIIKPCMSGMILSIHIIATSYFICLLPKSINVRLCLNILIYVFLFILQMTEQSTTTMKFCTNLFYSMLLNGLGNFRWITPSHGEPILHSRIVVTMEKIWREGGMMVCTFFLFSLRNEMTSYNLHSCIRKVWRYQRGNMKW